MSEALFEMNEVLIYILAFREVGIIDQSAYYNGCFGSFISFYFSQTKLNINFKAFFFFVRVLRIFVDMRVHHYITNFATFARRVFV